MNVAPSQIMLPLAASDDPTHPTNAADDGNGQQTRRTTIGHSTIEYSQAASILSKATGFIDAFDYTLNPYSGCTFGCTYCYAAFFTRNREQQDTWGHWVRVKENALDLLKRKRTRPLTGKTIFMSSVTDPYQPIERELELTRRILEELVSYHQPRLVIQTRGPLVTRDIDLLKQFQAIRVNMTITTDDDTVRKVFEPFCASIPTRLEAIARIHQAGIPTCITMTPLLPVTDAETFAKRLMTTGVSQFVIQHFHPQHGKFVAGTREEARQLFRERNWDTAAYRAVFSTIKQYIPTLAEGRDGFVPV